jgi:hypothetical protein
MRLLVAIGLALSLAVLVTGHVGAMVLPRRDRWTG